MGNDQNLLEEEDLQMQQEGREESLTQSGRENQEQSDNIQIAGDLSIMQHRIVVNIRLS